MTSSLSIPEEQNPALAPAPGSQRSAPGSQRGARGPSGFIAWARQRAAARAVFGPLLVLVVCAGLTRSYIATRWDSFTIDEAWHVAAGVSYARTLDYRLNPEHPPLIKLWVGAALDQAVFTLPPFRPLADKEGERHFINEAVYLANDVERVQARARLAMLAFHGLLLVAFGLALRRIFGPILALWSVGLLLLDPTVAAHLPLVMTDLPVALTSACAMLCGFVAFRSWRALDLGLCALALGLTLAAKHTGVITGLVIAGLAVVMIAAGRSRATARQSWARAGAALGVLFGAYLVLWACYAFRFREAPDEAYTAALAAQSAEHAGPACTSCPAPSSDALEPVLFNRPMADKIADLRSPAHRAALQLAVDAHLLPRSYLWGLADILRVGMEGRYETLYVFGHRVEGTPWYFFPAALLAKLPLGLIGLALLGASFMRRRSLPAGFRAPLWAFAGMTAVYMAFLMRGNSGYAGVRHALIVLPFVALLAALPIALVARGSRRGEQVLVALLALGALWSAVPVMRPWEYYNELAGGTSEAWRSFTDDGLDIRQRTKELAWYYDEHLRGTDQPVYEFYDISSEERQGRRLSFRELTDDPNDSNVLSGTLLVNARWLAPRPIYDYASLRDATPVARFGNLMVFQGQFQIPWLRAARRLDQAWEAMSAEPRDAAEAERLFAEAVALYPDDYGSSLELGNLLVERRAAEPAISAYQISREHAPPGDDIVNVLSQQIEAIRQGRVDSLGPIRNPWIE